METHSVIVPNDTIELAKICVVGGVDSGKSTLIGVLESEQLDDGRGLARSKIRQTGHERTSGRTSTHTPHYMCRKNTMCDVNHTEPVPVLEVTTLVDLCGHERYLRTTISGITGLFCNYGIVIIGANMGIREMTTEHLVLLTAVKIPYIIVVTKTDIVIDQARKSESHQPKLDDPVADKAKGWEEGMARRHDLPLIKEIKNGLNSFGKRNRKTITYITNGTGDAVSSISTQFHQNRVDNIPVIFASSKTGDNIDFLRDLLFSLRSRSYMQKFCPQPAVVPIKPEMKPEMNPGIEPVTMNPEMNPGIEPVIKPVIKSVIKPVIKSEVKPPVLFIDSIYMVKGIGIVLSGTVKYGDFHLGDKVWLGPINGNCVGLKIKSIKNCISEDVNVLRKDDSGSFGITLDNKKFFNRSMYRRGMIVTTDKKFAIENTCREFVCKIAVFKHATSIRNKYQSMFHCCMVRQTASLEFGNDKDQVLNSGRHDNVDVYVKFIQRSEFILPGTVFLFRDGTTKGIGRITQTISTTPGIVHHYELPTTTQSTSMTTPVPSTTTVVETSTPETTTISSTVVETSIPDTTSVPSQNTDTFILTTSNDLKSSTDEFIGLLEMIKRSINLKYPHLYVNTFIEDGLTLNKELDNGHIEYKRTLCGCSAAKATKYGTQMKYRIMENKKNIAMYYIGIDDDGSIRGLSYDDILESIDSYVMIVSTIDASIIKIDIVLCNDKTIIRALVKLKVTPDNYTALGYDLSEEH